MGINYFTDEQLKELKNNPYVVKCSAKNITYAEEFKDLFKQEEDLRKDFFKNE